MKLKALKPRLYNIMFHTHTVAGIVISFALFITFYAGAFSLFRDELYLWQNHQARNIEYQKVDSDEILNLVTAKYPNFKKDGTTNIIFNNEKIPYVQIFAELETEDKSNNRIRALVNPNSLEVIDDINPKTSIGETLYHLHYYRQIPIVGTWISGFVALFFLFAIVTGVLIHWKNMVRKFYAFSIKGKLKNLWTDAHTMLSIIGLPFQLIYALTGCLLGLLTLLLAPSVILMFNGSQDPIFEHIAPQQTMKTSDDAALSEMVSINTIYNNLQEEYPDHNIFNELIIHYGYEDATISFNIDDEKGIVGDGNFTYSLVTGEQLAAILPNNKTYTQTIYNLMTKLHYAAYGGILLKIVYFILALITCFSLISGILIWKTARQKKNYTEKQQRFHHHVTKIFLAISLGLFPAIGLLFIANKAIPFTVNDRAFYEKTVFFLSWLLLIIIGLFWNDLKKLNNRYLILGGVISLLIPIINGIVTGDWLFYTFTKAQYAIASVDIFWLLTGISALIIVYATKNSKKISE